MAERFVAQLYSRKTNFSRYPNEVDALTEIVLLQGFDPTKCLFRGYSGAECVERAAATGDDATGPRDSVYAMEVKRRVFRRGQYKFSKDRRLRVVTSPMYYASNAGISGVSVYNIKDMKPSETPYLWRFNESVTPKDALLGVIVIADADMMQSRWARLKVDFLVSFARRKIRR